MSDLFETSSAEISADGVYRYRLDRLWDPGKPRMVWCMLNPSTADADVDDATIRRCRNFAKREGCGGIIVINLFALRATDPRELLAVRDPVGPDNLMWIEEVLDAAAHEGWLLVCGWGAWWSGVKAELSPVRPNVEWLAHTRGLPPHRLGGETQRGDPKHPLYLAADTPLERFPITYQSQTYQGNPWLVRL